MPASGGNFAFVFPPEEIKIKYIREDGSIDIGHVNVIAVIPYLVMKTIALGRGKSKDAYDIYFTINNYIGGVRRLVEEIVPYSDKKLIQDMCEKLNEKFASPNHAGPADVAAFMDISDDGEVARIKQDAYQKVSYLVNKINRSTPS